MIPNKYEYSFESASRCRDTQSDRLYFDWFLKRSTDRVLQASGKLGRMADGRDDFDATTIGSIRAHMATISMVDQGLAYLREHFGNVPDKHEQIQNVMGSIAVDVDSADESFQRLLKAFGGRL